MAHSVVSDLSGETQEYIYDGSSMFLSDGQNFEISELLANDAAKGELKNENCNAENFNFDTHSYKTLLKRHCNGNFDLL